MLHSCTMTIIESIGTRLRSFTETWLSRRKKRQLRRHEKQKKKHPVVDWIEAFLWAAMVVLVINQYFFQAYRIPSGSMIPTFLIGDNLFVNKLVFGPELLPGWGKLPGYREPARNNVIIFENPDYQSRGPVFTLAKRLIYMLTLSLVDIERLSTGAEVQDLLIKRAIGFENDRLVYRLGDSYLLPAGSDRWLDSDEYRQAYDYNFPVNRLAPAESHLVLREAVALNAWINAGFAASADSQQRLTRLSDTLNGYWSRDDKGTLSGTWDRLEQQQLELEAALSIDPSSSVRASSLMVQRKGWYVPEGRVLPLGDNRDDSRDGRYFGPVPREDILGEAAIRYWPVTRAGLIH